MNPGMIGRRKNKNPFRFYHFFSSIISYFSASKNPYFRSLFFLFFSSFFLSPIPPHRTARPGPGPSPGGGIWNLERLRTEDWGDGFGGRRGEKSTHAHIQTHTDKQRACLLRSSSSFWIHSYILALFLFPLFHYTSLPSRFRIHLFSSIPLPSPLFKDGAGKNPIW